MSRAFYLFSRYPRGRFGGNAVATTNDLAPPWHLINLYPASFPTCSLCTYRWLLAFRPSCVYIYVKPVVGPILIEVSTVIFSTKNITTGFEVSSLVFGGGLSHLLASSTCINLPFSLDNRPWESSHRYWSRCTIRATHGRSGL